MPPLFVLRRTRHNRNSLAPLVRALTDAGPAAELSVILAGSAAAIPDRAVAVGYSFCTLDLKEIVDELQKVRRRFGPRVLLVAGGAHASADPEGCLTLGFDAIFVGEGEKSVVAFARELRGGATGPAVRRAVAPPADLDAVDHVAATHGLFPFVEITRGCPHRCAFCQVPGIFGRRMRYRSPQRVEQGIRRAVAAGYHRFRYLTPDAFAYRPGGAPALEAITELLDRAAGAGASQQMLGSFPSEVRPDRVTAPLLQLVRDRCTNQTLVIGAQSGSDRVLALMGRGHTVAQSREAIALTSRSGLTPHVDILLGYPGEDPDEQHATLELARWCALEVGARLHAHVYLPLPGCPAWPAPPAPLDRGVVAGLHALRNDGLVDGYWERQVGQGRQLLRWRERGLIRV